MVSTEWQFLEVHLEIKQRIFPLIVFIVTNKSLFGLVPLTESFLPQPGSLERCSYS